MLLFTRGDTRADDDHASVRWDIIRVVFNEGGPGVIGLHPGGEAWASTLSGQGNAGNPPGTATTEKIKLTGSGTFRPPKRNKVGYHVTGGGTWQTFRTINDVRVMALGGYRVTAIVSWEIANFQTPGFIDHIGNADERANGTAVLKIRFSDGEEGTLVLGCHGPGAPGRIFEGITVTKGFETYWYPESPGADPNKNRTLFHVSADHDDDGDDDDGK